MCDSRPSIGVREVFTSRVVSCLSWEAEETVQIRNKGAIYSGPEKCLHQRTVNGSYLGGGGYGGWAEKCLHHGQRSGLNKSSVFHTRG